MRTKGTSGGLVSVQSDVGISTTSRPRIQCYHIGLRANMYPVCSPVNVEASIALPWHPHNDCWVSSEMTVLSDYRHLTTGQLCRRDESEVRFLPIHPCSTGSWHWWQWWPNPACSPSKVGRKADYWYTVGIISWHWSHYPFIRAAMDADDVQMCLYLQVAANTEQHAVSIKPGVYWTVWQYHHFPASCWWNSCDTAVKWWIVFMQYNIFRYEAAFELLKQLGFIFANWIFVFTLFFCVNMATPWPRSPI